MTTIIEQTDYPLTSSSLAEAVRTCGLKTGQTVLVHMAMSKLGWVIGGAEAVLRALLDVLGESGTLMMPTHTLHNIDPAEAENPPIPQEWWPLIRDHMPAYNPHTTPSSEMGVVPELFRSWPGVVRSAHPATSFAAFELNAASLTTGHPLDDETGEGSPIGKLYDLGGHVLLLGVTHWENTSLHLSEERANYPGKSSLRTGSAMMDDNERQWVEYEVFETGGDDFATLGLAYETANSIVVNQIADAYERASQHGYVEYVTDRALGRLRINDGFEPD